ncbi:nitrilase-related carbon-nitrogen hydrolase [Celeribacter sp. PS-C1]|uniref:nitrilase-related carbon-nitrogen hydrolase n=1 Tax=Celeribacter sp. PS-C1 TaxID=2820813 RepID=UPI001CA4CA6A|nr:nitrilase-related carbon-nitrogen hydrolase [Celeribacter sp. PS-C1]MBW6418811.1 nitrilase [Celeribacter sp. PS-C1]
MSALTVALWQAPSVAGDCDLAFDQIASASAAAGLAGAEVVVFPELFLTGYERPDLADLALNQETLRARLAPLAQAAGCAICVGYPERAGDTIYNAALCVSAAGETLGNHRKIQLYGPEEAERFTPGDRYTLFELAGRKAAMLICYDVEFAPHIAALKRQGVEIILTPTAAMDPFDHVGAHVVPAMAANHGLSIVYANLCGTEAHLSYFGGSVFVGADGKILAQAGRDPAMLLATVPACYDPSTLSTQERDYRPIDTEV